MAAPLQALLMLCCLAAALCYPMTCYTKVLGMGRNITELAAEVKRNPETELCTAHFPWLYIDVHNACIMQIARMYMNLLDSLHAEACARNRNVGILGAVLRQLYLIMAHKCHGELVFSVDDCAALYQVNTET